MDRDSLRSGGVGRRSGSQSRGSMQQRKPLSIPASSATDTPTTGSAFDSRGLDAQSALYESIDDDDIVYDQGQSHCFLLGVFVDMCVPFFASFADQQFVMLGKGRPQIMHSIFLVVFPRRNEEN